MSDETLERLIRQHIRAQEVPEVGFVWQGGEPTLLGLDFFRRVTALQEQYRRPGVQVTNALVTNGTRLDETWCTWLSAHGFLVGLSLDGPARVHDPARGGSHAAALRALTLLRRHGVAFNVLCVVSAANVDRPRALYEWFTARGVEWLQFIPLVEPGGGGASVGADAWGRFLVEVFDTWARHDVGRVHVQTFDETYRAVVGAGPRLCSAARTCGAAIVVEHDGTVYSCDHYVSPAYRLGDIAQTPLAQLVDGPVQRDFGAAKCGELSERCRACDVLAWCWGECPRNRFLPGRDNWLCDGLRRFYRHAVPALRQLAVTG